MMMILLWAMACLSSMKVGMRMWARKSASVYRSLRWLLSSTATTFTPRLFAFTMACAMGFEVNE